MKRNRGSATYSDQSNPGVNLKIKQEETDVESSGRDQKRRRVLLVGVVVPTLKEVKQQKLNKAALDKLLKKKKKKGGDIGIPSNILESRLALIDKHVFNVDLPIEIKTQSVTRDFMAATYGGSMQATRPTLSKANLRRHGYRNFAYLHIDYHPHAPQVAGHPGLFFGTKGGRDWEGGLYRVITKVPKEAKWEYKGQYEVKACASLTKEEWSSLGIEVRAHWVNQICRQKWGKHVRSRIQARRELGRSATPEEAEAVRESGRWENITTLDVMQAYDRGHELFGVWTLKCVEYDEAFQRELFDKFPRWVKPLRRPKGAKRRNGRDVKSEEEEEVLADPGLTSESEDEDLIED